MASIPPEPPTWDEPLDPEEAARILREQLAHAKARMQEHREVMRAAGLTTSPDPDAAEA